MSRPADTAERLSDYLWWLLPTFLKKKGRAESLLAIIFDALGEELGEVRTTISDIIPLVLAETATGAWLDMLARARQIVRTPGESDTSLRVRVLAAYEIKRKAGTLPGMVDGLATIGYTASVSEPNKGTNKWSRFLVTVTGWDGVVANQDIFYQVVNQLRPAHTRALIESELTAGTWDDWELGAEELTLDDEGQLDDWTM